MVKKTAKLIYAFLIILSSTVYAETKLGAEISFNSGWGHLSSPFLQNDDFWFSTAQAKVKIAPAFSSSVKAYLEGRFDICSVPQMINPIDNSVIPAEAQTSWSLHKAYMKFRLPFGFKEENIRIAAGKMPLSWGYGLFYNAGDLIFGGNPLSSNKIDSSKITSLSFSSSTLSEFRTLTDWIFTLTVPLVKGIQIEVLTLPPIENASLYNYGRFGGRVQFNWELAALENMEAGYIAEGNFSSQSMYVSFDGNIWFDYNANAKGELKKDEGLKKESLEFSLSLSKIFNVRTDVQNHQLQIRWEGLWTPFAEKSGVFGFVSYQAAETVSLSGTYIFSSITGDNRKVEDKSHFLGFSIVWEPVKALELSAATMMNVKNPDELCTVSAGIKYRY